MRKSKQLRENKKNRHSMYDSCSRLEREFKILVDKINKNYEIVSKLNTNCLYDLIVDGTRLHNVDPLTLQEIVSEYICGAVTGVHKTAEKWGMTQAIRVYGRIGNIQIIPRCNE